MSEVLRHKFRVQPGDIVLERHSMPSAVGELVVHIAGNGPPLLLLHGGAGSWDHWIRNIPALAAHYAVHAPDLPGCGDSADASNELSADEYCRLTSDAIGNYFGNRDKLRIAGFSFGGGVAAGVAARLGSRVARLALAAPGGFGIKPALVLRKLPADRDDAAAMREVLRYNIGAMLLAKPESVDAATIELHRRNMVRARFDSRKVSLGDNIAKHLKQVKCRVQIILGEKDAVAMPSVAQRIAMCRALVPDARVDVIPGAGHWVQYEAPDAVNEKLLAFLA